LYIVDDRQELGPRGAFLVGVRFDGQAEHEVDEHLEELAQLVDTCGGETLGTAVQRRRAPDVATFIGRGKAEEVGQAAKELGAEVVIFDDDLSPSQVKNLEKAMELAVMDRSAVILEIFDRRARSSEARTQVQLARLRYLLPRLTRLWGHLSRQVGGIGVRGGTGETQLETDRRMMRQRIVHLEKDLKKIERSRTLQRRNRSATPTIALAGYTNAGKSTLFNRLTKAGSHAEDRLFATLDSRLRRGAVAPDGIVIFADTVGFIRKLPHHLVSSFRSTLEEITEADVVLHVIDRSHDVWRDQQRVAEEVMEELGVDKSRILNVYNKADRFADGVLPALEDGIYLSALTGEGMEALRATLYRRLFPEKAQRAAAVDRAAAAGYNPPA
jgi:GTP-binding protein HflX